MKINILVEEGWRRVRNCSDSIRKPLAPAETGRENERKESTLDDFLKSRDEVEDDEVVKNIQEFNHQMKRDGHKERFRGQVTRTIIEKWRQRLEDDRTGMKSYYRNRDERQASKSSERKNDKKSWF